MNREERRKRLKENKKIMPLNIAKEKTIQQYRDSAYREGYNAGVHSNIEVILYMVAYTLNYKLGFGNKRLCDIMGKILENVDCFRTGQLDPNDYKEIIKICNNLGFKV